MNVRKNAKIYKLKSRVKFELLKLKYFDSKIKCADELIGKNSVMPCTIDNKINSIIVY